MKPCECFHENANHEPKTIVIELPEKEINGVMVTPTEEKIVQSCNIPGCECEDFKEQKQGAKANEKIQDGANDNGGNSDPGNGNPSVHGGKLRRQKSKKA